jgi:hypothetical protein
MGKGLALVLLPGSGIEDHDSLPRFEEPLCQKVEGGGPRCTPFRAGVYPKSSHQIFCPSQGVLIGDRKDGALALADCVQDKKVS